MPGKNRSCASRAMTSLSPRDCAAEIESGAPLPSGQLRDRMYNVIFESDMPAGKLFDIVLLVAILLNVLATCLETVDSFHTRYSAWLRQIE